MAEIPKTMKGVVIEKTGGVEVLQYRTDLPVPTPKDGEILVKNEIVGVNYIDTCVAQHPTARLISAFRPADPSPGTSARACTR